jgi:hypothetical protein
MNEKLNKSEKIQNRESWLKTGVIIFFSLILGIPLFFKLISNELQIDLSNFNFESLLTLIVSFFSIGLSVMFYFKATDSSNEFYNNSYTFTKDISETLRGIEAGFGEKLTNIDKGYEDFRKSFENYITPQEKLSLKKEVEKETQNIKEIGNEKDKIIAQLKEKTNLSTDEIKKYLRQIQEKDLELIEKNNQIDLLKNQLKDGGNRPVINEKTYLSLKNYTKLKVIPLIPSKILNSRIMISSYFKTNKEKFSEHYMNDLKLSGFIDEDNILTKNGIDFINSLIEE